MREILFRGQRVDNGQWVYGSLINNAFYKVKSRETVFYIFNPEDCEDAYSFEDFTDNYGYYEVKPESIGQFTGLLDKNGNKIFEGDLVKMSGRIYQVVYNDGAFYLRKHMANYRLSETLQYLEIIGNIHEDGDK